jgi:hypothetical protein
MTSSTGQYSYFQQSNVGFGYDLNLITPNSGLFHIGVNGIASLPTSNSGTGLSIGWNQGNGGGETDFINYAQGSPTGGFNFYNVSGSTNSTLIGQIPTTQPAFNDTSTTSIPTNYWVQNAIINGIAGGGGATLGGTNTWTAQNTFTNLCPQSTVAPTVNSSLVNLQYLNTQIANLRKNIPLKAVENFSPLTGDYINTLTINSWANYLINEFITIKYTLSNNYPYTDTITASINCAQSTGYLDIYPLRLALGNGAPIGSVFNYNVLNNTLNGNNAYDMNSTLVRGRWFWAYNQFNLNAPANGFYLYIQNVSGQVLDIGLYIKSPSTGNQYSTSFTIELISSIDSSKITTSNFNVSNF